MCEDATAKERAKLLLDEARRRLLPRGRAREELLQLLADDLVQEGLLRLVAPILGHGAPFRDRRGAAPRDRLGVKAPASEGADPADCESIEALLANATASLEAQADAARAVWDILFFETSDQLGGASQM